MICVIANGYAEEMMASILMKSLRVELQKQGIEDQYQFVGGSLVSSGRWFQEEKFATFFAGGVTPSGGFPTRSIGGFFADLRAGAFLTPFKMINKIKAWSRYHLNIVIVVGDFLLLSLAISAIKKKGIFIVFIPTAKSDYIQPHFKIEKENILKYATITFPRDQVTTNDFVEFGINAQYVGNLMQDLLDEKAPLLKTKDPIVALLPGSREESYGNLKMILEVVSKVYQVVHWALVLANTLNKNTVWSVFEQQGWICQEKEAEIPVWLKDDKIICCYPSTMFDSVALSCVFGISLAGTGSEQIVGLGKPVIGFRGTGPQSTNRRMEDNAKLLGDAFFYARRYPQDVQRVVEQLLENSEERDRMGMVGLARMGKRGAANGMAQCIVEDVLLEKD